MNGHQGLAALAVVLRQSPEVLAALDRGVTDEILVPRGLADIAPPDAIAAAMALAVRSGLAEDLDALSLEPQVEHRFRVRDVLALASWAARARDALEVAAALPREVDSLFCTWSFRSRLPLGIKLRFRDLDRMILSLIASARESLVLVSPFLGTEGIRLLREPLSQAAQQGAWIRLVTEAPERLGEASNEAALAAVMQGPEAAAFRRRMRILVPAPSTPGLLHAKIVIADRARGYLGSANLTGRGLDVNFEIGMALAEAQALVVDELIRAMEAAGWLLEWTGRRS